MIKKRIRVFNDLNPKELYQILQLRSEVFVLEQDCAYQDCDGKDLLATQLFYVDSDEVVAGVRLLPKGISYAEVSIGRVVVHPSYRKQKLGFQMMQEAISFIEKEWGEKAIRISAQHYLLQFYESLGFKVVSEVYLEDNIPHIEMLYQTY